MNAILLLTLITAPIGDVTVVTPAEAQAQLAKQVQTGSLIVSRGDCLAVKAFSASRFTHVATVVIDDGNIYCYDSAAGDGVRKQTLAMYLDSQREASLHPFHPSQPLTKEQVERLESHLDSQLGRPYAIKHHVTGGRAKGIHCAEYATEGLIACGLLSAKEPSRVSPASLVDGLLKAELYKEADTLQLAPEPPPQPAATHWCCQLWLDTKQCTSQCYRQMRAWFCCK
jgi:hypothetical protein